MSPREINDERRRVGDVNVVTVTGSIYFNQADWQGMSVTTFSGATSRMLAHNLASESTADDAQRLGGIHRSGGVNELLPMHNPSDLRPRIISLSPLFLRKYIKSIAARMPIRSCGSSRYEGDFLKGQIHGRGRYMWSDGGHYEASQSGSDAGGFQPPREA